MIKPNDHWWYAVVSASPDPEVGDIVNVAVITGRGEYGEVDFIKELPKLSCLVGSTHTGLYRAVLSELNTQACAGTPIGMLRSTFGPQLRISEPRRLRTSATSKVRQQLRHRYLEAAKSRAAREAGVSARAVTRRKLDALITPYLPLVKVDYRKTARAERLYPDARAFFANPVPPLDRALRTRAKDLLIGAVSVGQGHPISQSRDTVARVQQAFWQYRQAREEIEEQSGRRLRLLGVVIAEDDASMTMEGRELALHMWGQDADGALATDAFGFSDMLRKEIGWLGNGAAQA
jgi:hypothetical protein